MELKGHIHGCRIVLDADPGLPDGAAVRIVLTDAGAQTPVEQMRDGLLLFAGTIEQGPPADLAENHDRYLYGGPGSPSLEYLQGGGPART